MIDSLFRYAKFQYECGNYSAASLCLYYYRSLVPQQSPNYLNALYGKLASEILLQVRLFIISAAVFKYIYNSTFLCLGVDSRKR